MIIKSVKTCITYTIDLTSFTIEKKEVESNKNIIKWDYVQEQNSCYCSVKESNISIFKNEIKDENIYNNIKDKEISINEYEFEFAIDDSNNDITKLIFKVIIKDENDMTTETEYEWDNSHWTSTGS